MFGSRKAYPSYTGAWPAKLTLSPFSQETSELYGPRAEALKEQYQKRKRALRNRGNKKKKKKKSGARAIGTAAIMAATGESTIVEGSAAGQAQQ